MGSGGRGGGRVNDRRVPRSQKIPLTADVDVTYTSVHDGTRGANDPAQARDDAGGAREGSRRERQQRRPLGTRRAGYPGKRGAAHATTGRRADAAAGEESLR